jgi:hypothetical protein
MEKQMQGMYGRLSEKDRRLYAGVGALKLPYGGISYIAELFGCSRNTVMRGITELGAQETLPRKRDRRVVNQPLEHRIKQILMKRSGQF